MPHSFGYRARTRHLFARDFRKHGPLNTQTHLETFKVGQVVDIKGNGSVHQGLPHKYYHGKTGIVWNVTPRAIGIEVNKLVGGRILKKRIHVRTEHAKHSKCRAEFLARVERNRKACLEAKKSGKKVNLKRQPELPRAGAFVKAPSVETLSCLPFVNLYCD